MLTVIKILLTLGALTFFMLFANKTSGRKDVRLWHEPEGIVCMILFLVSAILVIGYPD